MSQLFSSLLGGATGGLTGGIASGIGSLLSTAAQVAQPGPSQASRGADYNPVTSINDVGGTDLAGLAQLESVLNAGNTANGGLFLKENPTAPTYSAQTGTSLNPTIIIGIAIVVGIIIWRMRK